MAWRSSIPCHSCSPRFNWERAIFVPRLVTWVPVCTEMCQEVAVVQSLSHVPLFVTQWTAARQALLSSPSPRACSNSCSWSWWCHPTITSSVIPFSSCLQSFPASGSFPMSQFFTSGGQSIGASVSILPMNIQDWFPLGLTGLIDLQSKGLSMPGAWLASAPLSPSLWT